MREAEKLELTCTADGDGAAVVGYKLVDGEGRTLVEGDVASSAKRSLVKSSEAVALALESRAGDSFIYDVPENPNPDFVIPSEVDGLPVTAVGPSAFEDAMWLRSVAVPEGVDTIGESAFAGCSALSSVELPSTLREIGGSAFEGCSALAAADVPAGADLGDHAFAGCTALARVSLPEGVTAGVRHGEYDYEYGGEWWEGSDYVFAHCESLASIELPGSLLGLPNHMFEGCSALERVRVGEGVECIGFGNWPVFGGCESLASVELPSTLREIGAEAFYGCWSLVSIDLPAGLREIDDSAFYGCGSLAEIALPASLESVGRWAFQGCAPAVPVALPAALSGIGERAFEFGCDCPERWDDELGEHVTDHSCSYEIAPATWAQYWKLSGNARYIDPETTTVSTPNTANQGAVGIHLYGERRRHRDHHRREDAGGQLGGALHHRGCFRAVFQGPGCQHSGDTYGNCHRLRCLQRQRGSGIGGASRNGGHPGRQQLRELPEATDGTCSRGGYRHCPHGLYRECQAGDCLRRGFRGK